ncbi:MAG: multiheme c-type cytochrome [Nitrospiraceae bacterium]|nr:multiheme c-type cytochrome [Nitrospiraceae bacterium]
MRNIVAFFCMLLTPCYAFAAGFESWHEHHDTATPIWVLPKATAPENMRWTKAQMPGDVASKRFSGPEVCRGCHGSIYDQWKGSMMANSWIDPVFLAVYKKYIADARTETEKSEVAMCSRCHTPSGYLDNNMGRYFQGELSETDRHGISCDICHSVEASVGTGNGAFILNPGDASNGNFGTKFGPRSDSVSPFHATRYSELHSRGDFCGMCHDVGHAHNLMAVENTYTEWRRSPYYTGDPKTSTHCQDCHMRQNPTHPATGSTTLPDSPGFAAPEGMGAKKRDHIWQHYFIGGNFVVTTLLGNKEAARMAQDRLEHALTIQILDQEKPLKKGRAGTLRLKVINSGAGHYLPTGLTFVREMWIHLQVKDAGGNTVFESGALDAKGDIEPNAVVYKTVLGEGGEERSPTFFLPAAFEVLYDKRIPPKGYSLEKYHIEVPADARGPLTVHANINYRSAPQSLINELLGKDAPVLPVFTMGKVEKTIALD